MEVAEHYESYKASFGRCFLKGYDDFSKNINAPSHTGLGSMHDLIGYLHNTLDLCAGHNAWDIYTKFITQHQEILLSIFDKMVEEKIGGYEDFFMGGIEYLYIKEVFDWNHFKYSRSPGLVIKFKEDFLPSVEIVPRYSSPFIKTIKTPRYLDADEAAMLDKEDIPKEFIEAVFKEKPSPEKGYYKLVSTSEIKFVPVRSQLNNLVIDWSLPLLAA